MNENAISGFTPARGTTFVDLMRVQNPTPPPPPTPAPAKRSLKELQATYDFVRQEEAAKRDQRTAVTTAIAQATRDHQELQTVTIPALQEVYDASLMEPNEDAAHRELQNAKAHLAQLRERVLGLQRKEKLLPRESSPFNPPEAQAQAELLHRASELALEKLDLSTVLPGLREAYALLGSNQGIEGWVEFLAKALPALGGRDEKAECYASALKRAGVTL